MYLPLLLFISFPILLAMEPKIWLKSWLTNEDYDKKLTKPLFKKDDYERIESFANDEFKQRDRCAWPPERCPCGNYKLDEMKLAYFQWENPVTHKMELARYLINDRLFGNGGVGKIIHATLISYPENKPHKCVAIKMAKEDFENVKEGKASINREIEVIKYFRGTKHIIGYGPRHYYMRNEKEPTKAIIMEIGQSFILNYWSKTEMKDHYSEELILKVLKQILIGIDEIHQKNVIHLDLKTANIVKMATNDIYLKLIDFGGAIELKNGETTTNIEHALIITPEFTAPEINVPKFVENRHKNIMISKKADIWSFGMIILDLLSYTTEIGSLIEKEENPKDFFKFDAANNFIKITTLKEGEKLDKKFEEELDNFLAISKMDFPRVSALLESCLKWKPEERPTAEELLKVEHLKDIPTPTENADFFGEMTEYLDEQFKNILLTPKKGQHFPETSEFKDKFRNQKEKMKKLIERREQQEQKSESEESDELSFKSAKNESLKSENADNESDESFKSLNNNELSLKNIDELIECGEQTLISHNFENFNASPHSSHQYSVGDPNPMATILSKKYDHKGKGILLSQETTHPANSNSLPSSPKIQPHLRQHRKQQQMEGQSSKHGNKIVGNIISNLDEKMSRVLAINSPHSTDHSAKHFSNLFKSNKISRRHSFGNLPFKQNPPKFSVRRPISDIDQEEQEKWSNLNFLKEKMPSAGRHSEIRSFSSSSKSKYDDNGIVISPRNKSDAGIGTKLSLKESSRKVPLSKEGNQMENGIDGKKRYKHVEKCIKSGADCILDFALGPAHYEKKSDRKAKKKNGSLKN